MQEDIKKWNRDKIFKEKFKIDSIRDIFYKKEYEHCEEFDGKYDDGKVSFKVMNYIMVFKFFDKFYKVEFSDSFGIKKKPFEVVKKIKTIEVWE